MWQQGIVPVLATLFLFAQFLNVADAAAYGETNHTHDGQPCIIAAVCKQIADFDISPDPVLNVPEVYHVDVADINSAPAPINAPSLLAIRAPPVRLL